MNRMIGDLITIGIIIFIIFAAFGMIDSIEAGQYTSIDIPFVNGIMIIFLWIMIIAGFIGVVVLSFRAWFSKHIGKLFLDSSGKFHRITDVRINLGSSLTSPFHIYFWFNKDKKSEWLHTGNFIEFFKTNKIMSEAKARKYYPHKLI
jgi:hypothetical protein